MSQNSRFKPCRECGAILSRRWDRCPYCDTEKPVGQTRSSPLRTAALWVLAIGAFFGALWLGSVAVGASLDATW